PSIAKPPAGGFIGAVPNGGTMPGTASVNMTLATRLEVWPTAVNSSVAPAASDVTNQVVWKLPLASAVTNHGTCSMFGSKGLSKRNTWHSTCSPGKNPVPEMWAVSPGG